MGLATSCPGCGGEGRAARRVNPFVRHYVCVSCAGRWGVREQIVSDTFKPAADEGDKVRRWAAAGVSVAQIARNIARPEDWVAHRARPKRKASNAASSRRYYADPQVRETHNMKRRLNRQAAKENANG